MSDARDAGGASWPWQRPEGDAPGPADTASRPAGAVGPTAPTGATGGPGAAEPPLPGASGPGATVGPFGPPPEAPSGWYPGQPPAAPEGYGAPTGPYGNPGGGYPGAYPGSGPYPGYGYGYGYAGPAQTDKGARNSLILAIVGIFICGVLFGPAAIVEGAKARKRIQLSNGRLVGDGLAIGGIVLGVAVTALSILGIVFFAIAASKTPTSRIR